jgi:hypothetical protein
MQVVNFRQLQTRIHSGSVVAVRALGSLLEELKNGSSKMTMLFWLTVLVFPRSFVTSTERKLEAAHQLFDARLFPAEWFYPKNSPICFFGVLGTEIRHGLCLRLCD